MRHDFCAIGLRRFDELIRQTLPVSGAIIDDRDFFRSQIFGCIFTQHAALLRVIRHYAKGGFEILRGVGHCGGRGRNLRDAAIVVDSGCGYGGAGIQMADHAADFVVHQLLRDDGGGLGVSLIVFADQLETHFAPAYDDAFGVGVVYRHTGAAFVILADVCLWAGQRRRCANAHHQIAACALNAA